MAAVPPSSRQSLSHYICECTRGLTRDPLQTGGELLHDLTLREVVDVDVRLGRHEEDGLVRVELEALNLLALLQGEVREPFRDVVDHHAPRGVV